MLIRNFDLSVAQLFRPTRGGPRTTSRQKRQHIRTWTGHFFCLADSKARKVPTSSEKTNLQNCGLGYKKLQFKVTDTEETVHSTLCGETGFAMLKEAGGFEILQCQSNCRELQVITCKWDVENLRAIIGTQAKIYVRPIQNDLSLRSSNSIVSTSLKELCSSCGQLFNISELRQHFSQCASIPGNRNNEDETSEMIQMSNEGATTRQTEGATTRQTEGATTRHTEGATTRQTEGATTRQTEGATTRQTEGATTRQTEGATTRQTDSVSVHITNDSSESHSMNSELESPKRVSDIVKNCVAYCKEKEITDPVDILRLFQSSIVTGRGLEVSDETDVLQGETNYILVDRDNVLQSAMEEIREIKDLRLCLEVQFYGEVHKQ